MRNVPVEVNQPLVWCYPEATGQYWSIQ